MDERELKIFSLSIEKGILYLILIAFILLQTIVEWSHRVTINFRYTLTSPWITGQTTKI